MPIKEMLEICLYNGSVRENYPESDCGGTTKVYTTDYGHFTKARGAILSILKQSSEGLEKYEY